MDVTDGETELGHNRDRNSLALRSSLHQDGDKNASARYAENEANYDKRNFHMNEFKRLVYQYQKNRFGGMRRVIDQVPYAII